MKKYFLLLFLIVFFQDIYSQDANSHLNLNSNNIAVDGYDLVSYFEENKAVEGKKNYKFTFENVNYYFSSEKHLNSFKKSPTKYLPSFGGWCAYAMGATGEKVKIDPESFIVNEGNLYLFYYSFFNDTKSKWNNDPKNLEQKAKINWKKITN
ncbi:YHS domain protein [Flavobacteriales bacterium]|nr:YHS domain protein [Flavobacteriales bacterium]MDB2675471.1 YHS domain protein [Flavobacteriales bacterium]